MPSNVTDVVAVAMASNATLGDGGGGVPVASLVPKWVAQTILNTILFLLVAGLSGTLDIYGLKQTAQQPKGIVVGLLRVVPLRRVAMSLRPMKSAVSWILTTDCCSHAGTGCLCQFVLLPALGFSGIQLFGLEGPYAVALMLVCSSPGGSYSNWYCSLFNGDLALSIAMTTVSTFVSLFMLPLNIFLYVAPRPRGSAR